MRFKEFEEKYINIIAKSFSAAGVKKQYTSDEAIEIVKASFAVIAKEFSIPEENMKLAIKNLENREKGLFYAAQKGVENVILSGFTVVYFFGLGIYLAVIDAMQ